MSTHLFPKDFFWGTATSAYQIERAKAVLVNASQLSTRPKQVSINANSEQATANGGLAR
jgi:beta-glucosidase/6-phospho-beta-glucosidase/beta-galactosidase